MRLLHTTNLELKEFFDEHIPKYAILSHRWETEEVSLEDFLTIQKLEDPRFAPYADFLKLSLATSKESVGYRKIVSCCKLAVSHGYEWVWIDTCCIDKSSSADLSEAINSMYQWYKDAGICFTYLSDVKATISTKLSGALEVLRNRWDWMEETEEAHSRLHQCEENWTSSFLSNNTLSTEFQQSKWFTRGWTLQELLAPRDVLFLNQSWSAFGDRQYLAREIYFVTGIPHPVLEGPYLQQSYSVAQKMCWASQRTTSRAEDIAYCLLGLFEVKMPLLYGEGTRAFRRLQEEILRNSVDETLFVWPRQRGYRSCLLAASPKQFAECGSIVVSTEIHRNPSVVVNQLLQMEVHSFNIRDYPTLKLKTTKLDGLEQELVPLCCRVGEQSSRNVTALIIVKDPKQGPFYRVWDCVRLNEYLFILDRKAERKTIYIWLK